MNIIFYWICSLIYDTNKKNRLQLLMNMSANKINIKVKFLLPGIFALVTCLYLHADVNDSAYIYINENAQIYGKELLVTKQTTPSKAVKKVTKVKKETLAPAPAENEATKEEPVSVVFPAFPFESSSSYFLHVGNDSGAISPQHRIGGNQHISKSYRGNAIPANKISDLSI